MYLDLLDIFFKKKIKKNKKIDIDSRSIKKTIMIKLHYLVINKVKIIPIPELNS